MIPNSVQKFLLLGCLFPGVLMAKILQAEAPNSIEFFETRIRPVLIDRCYECHASDADEIGGSLVLDSRDGMMIGGDSGPAIEPGNVDDSRLIAAIRYESTEMPPDGKLSDQVIRDFEQWISAGAIDSRTTTQVRPQVTGVDLEAGREFWAFQPLSSQTPFAHKATSGQGRPGGIIDTMLDQRLTEAELEPNGPADPELQLRRLAFDLTGLPPSLEMQRRWIDHPTERHWRRLVDELLSSPEFGEHWARHWMDVARYADSNGSDFNATFHEAWRYRDYLIRSFAADRPIDQMIRQQIAGDLLPHDSDAQRHDNVVATTFLMLGTKMLSERDKEKLVMDVVDEQIDTIGRAFLGLTLGCARCHDHKFDPVPTEDYYALAGIFKSTITLNGESQKYVSTWNRVPLPASDQHRREIELHQQTVQSLEGEIKEIEKKLKARREGNSSALTGIIVDDAQAEKLGNWRTSVYFKHFVGEGYVHDDNTGKGESSIRFVVRLPRAGRYEVRLSHSPGSSRAASVPVTIRTITGDVTVNVDQRTVQAEPMWSSLGSFELGAQEDTVVTISNRGTSGYVIADAIQLLHDSVSDASSHQDAERARAEEAIMAMEASLESLKQQLAEAKKSAPIPLPLAMAPTEQSTNQIGDCAIHVRGEVKNLGAIVPRGFLQVCSTGEASIRTPQGSGRDALADWLTDPDNPLVARVFVNRVWMHLMGEGLVRTVDNFGIQGERPTHPELLDHLAIDFVRGGWHLHALVRKVVTSQAYRRSTDFRPDAYAADPENKLRWRMHRRRLPAESIRDAMLYASGTLDSRPSSEPMNGHGVLVSSNNSDSQASFDDVASPRRSVYIPIVRGYLPPLMTALDMADPDLLVGQRPTTNVPAQALVLINSREVNDWAMATALRVLDSSSHWDDRLDLVFRLSLQRGATLEDTEFAREYFAGQESSLEAWHQFVAALFAGTPFRLLD